MAKVSPNMVLSAGVSRFKAPGLLMQEPDLDSNPDYVVEGISECGALGRMSAGASFQAVSHRDLIVVLTPTAIRVQWNGLTIWALPVCLF